MSRTVVPDKGSLYRERPVTKALKFPSCTAKSVFHLKWNGVCEENGLASRVEGDKSARREAGSPV